MGTLVALSIMLKLLLVLLALAQTSWGKINCYSCNNWFGGDSYDLNCGVEDYQGRTHTYNRGSCWIEIFHDSDGAMWRGGMPVTVEEGKCLDTGISMTCYCNTDNCNEHLCDHCF